MRHQRALRRPGRAARVDEERRIVGDVSHRRRSGGDARSTQRFARRRRTTRARPATPIDVREPRQRSRGSARDWAATADRRSRPSPREFVEPVLERVGTEQERQRHGDRAHLVDREVRDDRLAAAAAGSARPCRRARRPARASAFDEPVGLAARRSQKVNAARRAGLVLPVQREARAVARPAPAAGLRDVELRGDVPAVARRGARRSGRRMPMVARERYSFAAARCGACAVRRVDRRAAAARPRSRGSTAAHTQSGCCSSRRPKRIGLIDLRRHAASAACAGWYSTAGTISDCTADVAVALAQREEQALERAAVDRRLPRRRPSSRRRRACAARPGRRRPACWR